MGILSSKDTRRVSFDNTFALTPALNIQKSLKADDAIELNDLTTDSKEDLIFNKSRTIDLPQEEGDGDYWAHRIDCLKREHQSINRIIETEFEKTVKKTGQTFESPKITNERLQKLQPCFDVRAKILKCYEDNPHQPLMCSTLVQAFSQCVSTCRRED